MVPGAPETLQKGGGEAPRPSEVTTEAPRAAQTPKIDDFRPDFRPSPRCTEPQMSWQGLNPILATFPDKFLKTVEILNLSLITPGSSIELPVCKYGFRGRF